MGRLAPLRWASLETDAEILAHPVHREAEIEPALVHALPAIVHLPGLRRPLRDCLHHCGEIEIGVLGEGDGFRQALQQSGDGDLIDHLGELARAGRPHAPHGAAVGADDQAPPPRRRRPRRRP